MKKLDILVLVLLIIGGINYGLWGIFDFNLIDYVFGTNWINRVFYFLVGVAGIYAVIAWKHYFTKKAKK